MRKIIRLQDGWKFHRGDVEPHYPKFKGVAYVGAKTERAKQGPACKDYIINDPFSRNHVHSAEDWETVSVPHDYHAADGYDPNENEALGFCRYENGWYVLRFTVSPEEADRRLTLYFEGVTTHATVWLNGFLMKHNFCGYTSFEVDITDAARVGEENVLSVYVSTEETEGWWYEGGGITRPVWLVSAAKTAVDLYGVYVKPERQNDGTWCVKTETTVRNDTDGTVALRVENTILDEDGNEVATAAAGSRAPWREKRVLHTVMGVNAPALWSPETPALYTMRTRVFRGEKCVDEVTDRFGFRTFVTDPENGLFINGKPYKIKGFCGHESVGLCGRAVPDNLQRYRVKLMQEMGANGYRTSHYPQSVALMDALDEAGFIVMDETRWFESTEEGLAQLEMLVKRDRNRPGVFFWSVGNEEFLATDERGRRIFKTMKAFVKKLDDRPVTMAVTEKPINAVVFDECDAIGINYKWDHYVPVHEKHPTKPMFSAECGATGTTKGWYFEDDPAGGHVTAYDHTVNNAFRSREFSWKFLLETKWVMGGYHWNLGEYRGEAVWPRVSSVSGTLDWCLRKKDAFWQHQAFFTDTPMVHVLPHWNFAGMEGEPIRVVAYTNQPRAELFLNGKSLGAVAVERYGHAEWQVPYAPGNIEVRVYNKVGTLTATDRRETTGAPVALRLVADTADVAANGRDLALITCEVVDAAGRVVPDAEVPVRFAVSGAGSFYSSGAVNTDHTPITSPERTTWCGTATAAVRTGKEPGECTVIATAGGLSSVVFRFAVK